MCVCLLDAVSLGCLSLKDLTRSLPLCVMACCVGVVKRATKTSDSVKMNYLVRKRLRGDGCRDSLRLVTIPRGPQGHARLGQCVQGTVGSRRQRETRTSSRLVMPSPCFWCGQSRLRQDTRLARDSAAPILAQSIAWAINLGRSRIFDRIPCCTDVVEPENEVLAR